MSLGRLSDVVNKVQYDDTSAEGEPMVMLQLVPNRQTVRPPWKETRRWHALFKELAGNLRVPLRMAGSISA